MRASLLHGKDDGNTLSRREATSSSGRSIHRRALPSLCILESPLPMFRCSSFLCIRCALCILLKTAV